MDQERFEKQLRFILEIDREKNILRQTHLSGGGRQENDAEHAWHMAVMAYLLREYANEPIDLAKTMMMILIHDVVEIDAGTPTLTTRRERPLRESGRKRPQSGCSDCFRRIRAGNCGNFLRSLRPMRLRRPDLPTPWITFSR